MLRIAKHVRATSPVGHMIELSFGNQSHEYIINVGERTKTCWRLNITELMTVKKIEKILID